MNYEERIIEDTGLLESLDDALPAQKRHVKTLQAALKAANRILNHMLKARRDLRKDLVKAKRGKSAYPSRMRRYTLEHIGEILDRMEHEARWKSLPSVLEDSEVKS